MNRKLHLLFICLSLLLLAYPGQGQGLTTASIRGKVSSQSGESLPGATVVAVHTPTGTRYGSVAQLDGRYSLPNLRVGGPYTINVNFIGYQEKSITGVNLVLGQNLVLNFDMSDAKQQLEELVIESTQVMDGDKTGASTNFSNEDIRKLPTITRSASDIYRLNPASDGNSFGGRNDQYNNFSLDGSIFNNPFGLDAATPGGQTSAQPISLDAIDQIQVSLAPYDVTQSGFTGASINAVTKSGTNNLEGTVFGFFRNQDMTGTKVKGTDVFAADLRQLQAGFSIGGPIIKNKLFFFANMEVERREDLGSSFVAGRPSLEGENISRVQASDLEAVSSALQQAYGYETGAYENYNHQTNNQKGILKLDWNISNNHRLTATYNFLDAFQQKPAHPSALGRRGPDATTLQFFNSGYRINNIIHSGLVEWKGRFGDKVSNKMQVGYTSFRDSRDPFSSPFPVINIYEDGIPYIVAGHEPFSINNVLDQDVFQFTNNVDIFLGKHNITAGVSLEAFAFNNSFNLNGYGGTFGPYIEDVNFGTFSSVNAFLDAVDDPFFQSTVANARAAGDAGNWALAETNVGQFAVYAQDRIAISDELSVTVGLRADKPLYFNTSEKIEEAIDRACCHVPGVEYFDEEGNTVVFDHAQLPDPKILLSPRIGFNYTSLEGKPTQVRGGVGIFTGRFPFVWIGNQVANPEIFFYNVTDPNFQFPQVFRASLGYEQGFGEGWTASTDILYTKDINAMMVRNYGFAPPTGTLQGVDNRAVYTANDQNGAANDAFVFTNTDLGRSVNITLQLKRQWKNGLYTSLSYNYLDSKDASSIEAEISSDAFARNPSLGHVNTPFLAPSLYGNQHRFVGNANKTFTYGADNNMATTISVFFEYSKGGRFSYTYSGDINGDRSGLNDLLYIPTDSELNQMTFSGNAAEQDAQRAAFRDYILQDDYLNDRRGEYAERYAILSPWFSRWDIRILQDLKVTEGNSLQLSVDVLNAGNLISSNWGVRQFPQNTQPVGVNVADGVPTYSFDPSLQRTFVNDFSLNSRWQLQVGLRYRFK